MKRFPHNKQTPKAEEILEIIHSDIIGPINDSITGMKFIITFIDEKSHKSWIFLMNKKKSAIDIILKFLKYVNNLFDNKKVKVFKSNNARQYKNNKIIQFSENNGIQKIYSPTLISCAKTLLFWSKLSENFWDYAVLYANYLYNKTPHQISRNNIPDESFYGHKVKLDYIKTFGCITYYKNFDQNKGKFQPNASKGIFLGFNEETNSNLIMDYEDYKLHYVREILAFEDEPANISLSNSATDKEYNVYFFKFDFNFSKFENLRDHFFINNSNENFQILDNSLPENNSPSENNSNLNDLTNNNALTQNTLINKDFNNIQNDTNVNNISNKTNLELNDEDYFSAEENEFESISDQNEKIFNKNSTNFDSKIQNNKNNNDLSSNSQNCIVQNNNNLNLNEYQNIQNNNNLSSEKFNFLNQNKINYNNLDSKNLNSNNLNNINDDINNNLDSHKNFSSNANISNNNNGRRRN